MSHVTRRQLKDRGLRPASESGPVGEDFEWARNAVRRAWDNIELLGDSDLRFVDNFGHRLQDYGPRTWISGRQKDWLRRIVATIEETTRAASRDGVEGDVGP